MSKSEPSNRKFGDQTLKAMASLGLEELRNAVYPSSNVAQQSSEPGVWGDRSYGDVSDDRNRAATPERRSLLAEKVKQVEMTHGGREPEPPELSRE
ncbi:hypothetical protein [Humisphaera borealis]|uniref:Uncharacterized protein n=1 Tax=Humisphaera borealis TaxID=2807512 RepID=A0A7M2X378_9BACT|nr:hypothetical protein [Humisphaera borealis]QOV92079.1 hypothetical protein IPV69_12290 [Humisphaera borealis]